MYEQAILFPQPSETQPPTQAPPTSIPPTPIKHSRERPREQLEHVHIASPSDTCFLIDKCMNKDADDQPL